MELLRSYLSDNSSSGVSDDEVQRNELQQNQVRSVYLLTYSQADLAKFSRRESFADAVVKSFSQSTAKIQHWCCCREEHRDGGLHYHMAVKLDRNHRWLPSKQYLLEKYGISVHYSSLHHNYYSAWIYVTKDDKDFLESAGHPRLQVENEPVTNAASRARHERRSRSAGAREPEKQDDEYVSDEEDIIASSTIRSRRKKKKRLTAYEVSEIIVGSGVKTLTQLQALAYEQKQEGKIDLAEFLINRTPRVVADILQSAWEIEGAQEQLERSSKSRMELLLDAQESECVDGCNGEWYMCAREILRNNAISVEYFSRSVRVLLEKGRAKYRNIMIIGPANCGKTFLLNPLRKVYQTFCNPATGSFAWVGVEKAEVIFLNDFRWCQSVIPWHDLLLLLEGQEVHFPAPKTHFARDISLSADTPIFCTSTSALRYVKNGVVDDRETDMMNVRWNIMQLSFQIPRDNQRDIPPCPKCFASLVLQ